MSLRTRLDLLVSGILLLMLLSMLYVSTWRQSQQSLMEQTLSLQATAIALQKALKTPLITNDYATIDSISGDVINNSDITALRLTQFNRTLVDLTGARQNSQIPQWFRHGFNIPAPEFKTVISVGGVEYGELTLTGNTDRLYRALWQVATQMSLIALLAYAILNLSVWVILRHGFRPLELLQHAAEKLAKGIREPIDEKKLLPELRLPIQAFNQMSEEITRLIGELLEKHTDLQISAQAIESLNEGVVILNQDLSLKYANPFARVLHENMPSLMHSLSDTLDNHLSHSVNASLNLVTSILASHPIPELRTLDILINSVRLPHNDQLYYVIVVRDITEERAQKIQLAWEATHDILTGTLNRLEFAKRLNEHIASGRAGVLLFIDLDHFKRINDNYGHSVGDLFLKHMASTLNKKIGESNLLARFGGDEFLVLLKDWSLEQGSSLAEQLLLDIPATKLLHAGNLLHVTCSIGGIYFDTNTQLSAEMLVSHTDATMFEAKRNGRNRLAIFAHAMPEMERMQVDQDWISRLTQALESNHIIPMFQPIMRLADETISHYEALARMSVNGQISDALDFIPHAERLGLVGEIDVLILREVIRTLTDNPGFTIASNLSGYSMNNRHVQKRLFEILERNIECAPRLILEITESVAIEEIEDAKSFFKRAKALGCRFAIDDFGVGYSSLQTLSQLDVDYLKIDGSLLQNLHSENTALLKAVQGLADALQIPTVAEHVDTEEKLEVIKRIGINYAQGYQIGKAELLSPAYA